MIDKISLYFKQMFCRHELEYIDESYFVYNCKIEHYRCVKCGKEVNIRW